MNKILVFLWLLLLPTQLGKHFWPEWAQVMGLRIDYLSPTLYFLDLVWVTILFNHSPLRGAPLDRASIKKILNTRSLILFAFVLINIFVAENRWVAIFRWLRIGQWLVTLKLVANNKKLFGDALLRVIPFWLIGEGLLAVGQMAKGGSLNGVFYWLGERRFSYTTIGVAQISWFGEGLIRAYGTFSHPNSMAGFVLVSLMWLVLKTKKRGILYWMSLWMGLVSVVLAGSRTVWVIVLGLFVAYQLRLENWKQKIGWIFVGGGVMILIFSLIFNNYRIADFVGGWDSDGLAKRGGLMVSGIKMFMDNPIFGVGANNFLVRLPEYQNTSGAFWLQPIHNIFMMVIVEFGTVGLVLLIKNYQLRIKNKNDLIVLGIVVATGMVDHYWLTLPQNWWLLAVIFALK